MVITRAACTMARISHRGRMIPPSQGGRGPLKKIRISEDGMPLLREQYKDSGCQVPRSQTWGLKRLGGFTHGRATSTDHGIAPNRCVDLGKPPRFKMPPRIVLGRIPANSVEANDSLIIRFEAMPTDLLGRAS